MFDLQTIHEMNERAVLNRVAADVIGDPQPPTKLGKYFVFERGDTLMISEKPTLPQPKPPILVIDFAGERPNGPGKIQQLFKVQFRLGQHLRTAPTMDRRGLISVAVKRGIKGLTALLDDAYGKETYA